ncbi:MAG: alpha/beta hydrolase [Pseudolabrys sp.]|nr:alpha/beta hydrolase [Pseudolabrys sp.]
MILADTGFLQIGSQRLEYRFLGPQPGEAPTLVLLHEGLGSATMWGDFPEKLQKATGCGVFIYSREGYGQSSPAKLPRPLSFMHTEARETLPKILDAIGFQDGLLVGHSDGGSIATIYAGSHQDHRLRALVLMAPHFFVEDCTIKSIAEMRQAYDAGSDLRGKLARYHADVDATVRGWSDVWLKGDFKKWDLTEELGYIRVPILIVQGEDDHYGTVAQINAAERDCYCPVEVALLPATKHVPHREAPEKTLEVVSGFVNHVLRHEPAVV